MESEVCDNNLKFLFTNRTAITNIDIPEIPQHKFFYKLIVDFLTGNFQPERLYNMSYINPIAYVLPYIFEDVVLMNTI
ncbi:hypothetical protein RYX36_028486 [Vicia faba]